MIPVTAFMDLLSPDTVKRPVNPMIGLSTLDAEIRFASGPALRLWSHKMPIYFDGDYDQYAILDLVVLPDRVIFVQVSPGSLIGIWEVAFEGPPRGAGLGGWSLLGAAVPAKPGRLGAKIAYDDQSKAIKVEVTDTIEGTCCHTSFAQKPGQWDFENVKRWEEQQVSPKPATRP